MSESKARAKRQTERLSVDSQYILVRGLIIHRTAILMKQGINVDCLLDIVCENTKDMKAPDSQFLTSTKRQTEHQSNAFNRLEGCGYWADQTSRDFVTKIIKSYIQDNRNFWAHAYVKTDSNNDQILYMDKSSVYARGLPIRDAASEGLKFLKTIEPVCEYIDTQYNNVYKFLQREVLRQ